MGDEPPAGGSGSSSDTDGSPSTSPPAIDRAAGHLRLLYSTAGRYDHTPLCTAGGDQQASAFTLMARRPSAGDRGRRPLARAIAAASSSHVPPSLRPSVPTHSPPPPLPLTSPRQHVSTFASTRLPAPARLHPLRLSTAPAPAPTEAPARRTAGPQADGPGDSRPVRQARSSAPTLIGPKQALTA